MLGGVALAGRGCLGKRGPPHRGFSLLELVVVLAILGLLMGLTLAAVQRARDAAARLRCANNLRQIGLGLHLYHDTQRHLPPGMSLRDGADPYPCMSWLTRLLPYVEQPALWAQAEAAYARDRQFDHNPPHVGFTTVMPLYGCPADGRTTDVGMAREVLRVTFTSYLGVEGRDQVRKDGVLFLDSAVRFADITDGTSTTLMVGERPPSADLWCGWWYAGEGQGGDGSADMVLGVREQNANATVFPGCPARGSYGPGRVSDQCAALHFWSLHPGGANFLFCDGSVHFLPYSAAPIMSALASRSGGEAVAGPD